MTARWGIGTAGRESHPRVLLGVPPPISVSVRVRVRVRVGVRVRVRVSLSGIEKPHE